MQISEYVYSDGKLPGGRCGEPDGDLSALLERWNGIFDGSRIAFLDIPCNEVVRTIIVGLPSDEPVVFAFHVPLKLLDEIPSVYCFYHALERLAPEDVLRRIRGQAPLELKLEDCGSEQAPVPSVFSDLDGLQMIGSPEKSLQMISKMLPSDPDLWCSSFFLAVNPVRYDDAFTTVISEETPDGEWNSLKSEHTEFSNAKTFHERRLHWMARKLRPRVILLSVLLCLMFLSFAGTVFLFWRYSRNARLEYGKLTEEKKGIQFDLDRRISQLKDLEDENRYLMDEKRRLENEVNRLSQRSK